MSAPNIGSPTTINGKTALAALTGTEADIIGSVTTGHCIRVKHIICSNVTTSPHPVTIVAKRSSTTYSIATAVSIPANATIVFDGLYLEESDILRGNSDASSQIQVVVPYEDIS